MTGTKVRQNDVPMKVETPDGLNRDGGSTNMSTVTMTCGSILQFPPPVTFAPIGNRSTVAGYLCGRHEKPGNDRANCQPGP